MKRIFIFIGFLLFFSGCKKEQEVHSLWKPEELIKINSEIVTEAEIAVYGIQIKKEFEQIGGEEVWELENFSAGKSAYELAKHKTLENVIRVHILALKAAERKTELTAQERDTVLQQAQEFYADAELQKYAVTPISKEMAEKVFTDFALGQKLKNQMLQSFTVTPEMLEEALQKDESYQALIHEDENEEWTEYGLRIARIENTEENQELRSRLQKEWGEKKYLTDALTQSMVYEEVQYRKEDLRNLWNLEPEDVKDDYPILMQVGEDYYVIVGMRGFPNEQKPKKAKEDMEKQKESIEVATRYGIREDSFNVIYEEWKKGFTIQMNEEAWKGQKVFLLHPED